MNETAGGLAETANFIDNTGRIEKGVEVGVVDRDGLVPAGDDGAATTADKGRCVLDAGLVTGGGVRQTGAAG